MSKVLLYVATSVDGRIATADGEVRWLDQFFTVDYGFHQFVEGINSVVLGRKTYDQVRGFGPDWPYKGKRSVVLTTSPPDDGAEKFGIEFYSGDLRELRDELVMDGDAWIIGGGEVTREFLDKELVDELMLFVMPVLLGDGPELFPASFQQQDLRLLRTETYENGSLLLHYERAIPASQS